MMAFRRANPVRPSLSFTYQEAPLSSRFSLRSRDIRGLTVFVLSLMLLLGGCAHTNTGDSIIKSPNDDRSYHYSVLNNGLKVLVVSDASADKAAASLVVFRGSYNDPDERPGLAHFLEHMLFLGTQKYPDTDEYTQFVSTHGGSHNAYTAADHTNYFFDIQPEYLEGGLDRFAQFFIAPNFNAEYVEREKNAVNSEYQLQIKDDAWRDQAVGRVVINPLHPASRFTIGSLETLSGDVRSDLVKFFEQNYSADQMVLMVAGPQSSEELGNWVTASFSGIPNRHLGEWDFNTPMFAADTLPETLSHRTLRRGHELVYKFPTPGIDEQYSKKPLAYLSNLIGHEGENSLHSYLKEKGWIEALGSGGGRFDHHNGVLSVSIDLTDEGALHIPEISKALFHTIALIRSEGLNSWRYEEQARIADISFRFQEKTRPISFVYRVAPNFRLFPPKEVLVAPYLMTHYDEALIREFLNYLTPDNLLMEVASHDVSVDKEEKWFHVPYSLEPGLPLAQLERAADLSAFPEIGLPAANPFLPEDLSLKGGHDPQPHLLINRPGLKLWFATDDEFGSPRANTYIELATREGNNNPTNIAASRLYAKLVQDKLNAVAYPAQLAGLGYTVSATDKGFIIQLSGFSDKQPVLLQQILSAFRQTTIDADKFSLYQAELIQDWRNFRNERPYSQAYANLNFLLLSTSWPPGILANRLSSMTPSELKDWTATHLSDFSVTAMLHGNVTPEEARVVADAVSEQLAIADFAVPPIAVKKLAERRNLRFGVTVEHADSALVAYIQAPDKALSTRAQFGLAAQLIRSSYFNELRTNQQLGYVVAATPNLIRTTPGLAFIVQSPVAGPATVLQATEQFMLDYKQKLAEMSEKEFAQNKAGLISQLLQADKNLGSRSQRYWSDLDLGFLHFDSRKQLAAAVEAISKEQFEPFFTDLIELFKRNRLVVYVPGHFKQKPEGEAIESVRGFKEDLRQTVSQVESSQ